MDTMALATALMVMGHMEREKNGIQMEVLRYTNNGKLGHADAIASKPLKESGQHRADSNHGEDWSLT